MLATGDIRKNLVALVTVALLPVIGATQASESEAFWKEFANGLLAGNITADRVRPYYPELREPMLRFLDDFRRTARPEEWKAKPELHRVGEQIHGIISLTGADGKKAPSCFTLLVANSRW
jgi:hypothetical protein